MDQKQFKERAARLDELAKLLEKVPSEIRLSAFELLKSYVAGGASKPEDNEEDAQDPELNSGEFFEKFNHDKPADNAALIAAHLYREFGTSPFSIEEVRQAADQIGVTIPARVDMTFRQAQEKGKKLFVTAGRGQFKPTVHGEAYFKTKYSVKKGTKSRPENTK